LVCRISPSPFDSFLSGVRIYSRSLFYLGLFFFSSPQKLSPPLCPHPPPPPTQHELMKCVPCFRPPKLPQKERRLPLSIVLPLFSPPIDDQPVPCPPPLFTPGPCLVCCVAFPLHPPFPPFPTLCPAPVAPPHSPFTCFFTPHCSFQPFYSSSSFSPPGCPSVPFFSLTNPPVAHDVLVPLQMLSLYVSPPQDVPSSLFPIVLALPGSPPFLWGLFSFLSSPPN